MAATLNQEVHTTCRRRRIKIYYQDNSGSLRLMTVVYFDQCLGATGYTPNAGQNMHL